MSVKCVEIDNENISHSVTLTPRLEYSASLLDEIVTVISQKRDDFKSLWSLLFINASCIRMSKH